MKRQLKNLALATGLVVASLFIFGCISDVMQGYQHRAALADISEQTADMFHMQTGDDCLEPSVTILSHGDSGFVVNLRCDAGATWQNYGIRYRSGDGPAAITDNGVTAK